MEELIFQYMPVEVELSQTFGLFTRGDDTVVVLARDGMGQWMLGKKSNFYPEGIVRMIGGGMGQDKNPITAMQREIQEETGVMVDEEKLVPLVHAEVMATLPEKDKQAVSIFVFYTQITQNIQASDDITGIAHYSDHELMALVHRYEQLSADMPLSDGPKGATWADYGKVWGPIHKAALERVKELGL